MTTKTIPTKDLIGAALDWAVAEAAGVRTWIAPPGNVYPHQLRFVGLISTNYVPSTSWELAGPIIEKNDWCLPRINNHRELVHLGRYMAETPGAFCYYGSTPIIAALRAFVAAKLTDEVEVPMELVA